MATDDKLSHTNIILKTFESLWTFQLTSAGVEKVIPDLKDADGILQMLLNLFNYDL